MTDPPQRKPPVDYLVHHATFRVPHFLSSLTGDQIQKANQFLMTVLSESQRTVEASVDSGTALLAGQVGDDLMMTPPPMPVNLLHTAASCASPNQEATPARATRRKRRTAEDNKPVAGKGATTVLTAHTMRRHRTILSKESANRALGAEQPLSRPSSLTDGDTCGKKEASGDANLLNASARACVRVSEHSIGDTPEAPMIHITPLSSASPDCYAAPAIPLGLFLRNVLGIVVEHPEATEEHWAQLYITAHPPQAHREKVEQTRIPAHTDMLGVPAMSHPCGAQQATLRKEVPCDHCLRVTPLQEFHHSGWCVASPYTAADIFERVKNTVKHERRPQTQEDVDALNSFRASCRKSACVLALRKKRNKKLDGTRDTVKIL